MAPVKRAVNAHKASYRSGACGRLPWTAVRLYRKARAGRCSFVYNYRDRKARKGGPQAVDYPHQSPRYAPGDDPITEFHPGSAPGGGRGRCHVLADLAVSDIQAFKRALSQRVASRPADVTPRRPDSRLGQRENIVDMPQRRKSG